MVPMKSSAVPIYPGHLALISGAKPSGFARGGMHGFGTSPWRRPGLSGCGCGPTGGCSCNPGSGLNGLGQNVTLDSIIANAATWLGGVAQANLPTSAALPPNYGSPGAALTSLMGYLPYIIGGYLLYKLVK